MEVLCACDKRYLPHAATMLYSLLEHNNVSRIHFLYSSITNEHLLKLKKMAKNLGGELITYELIDEELSTLYVDNWGSEATYYRITAARVLPTDLKKVLYLDSDIIVRRSLQEVWDTGLDGHALAAVEDGWRPPWLPSGAKYFNAGVLLINLDYWRIHNIYEKVIAFVKNNPDKVEHWDQDALNGVLVNCWLELPSIWNAQKRSQLAQGPAIVHFIGESKPWHWANTHPLKHEYNKYRLKTPWRRYRLEKPPSLVDRLRALSRRSARVMLPVKLRQGLRAMLRQAAR